MASTHSPTLSLRESPIFTVGRSLASILITAMSVFVSMPMTLAVYSRRSVMTHHDLGRPVHDVRVGEDHAVAS